jgi:DNA helicase II / ATP-dependent DNA helicase PcrA
MVDVTDLLTDLNSDQLKAVTHQAGPAMVLAGAGSGKTKVLTTRVAWLLANHMAVPEEILLATFTNKAAQEMNRRVFDLTGFSLPFAGTFHSLCAKILRKEAHHLHLPIGFSIYDAADQTSLINQIYKANQLDAKRYKPVMIKAKISEAKNELLTPERSAAPGCR